MKHHLGRLLQVLQLREDGVESGESDGAARRRHPHLLRLGHFELSVVHSAVVQRLLLRLPQSLHHHLHLPLVLAHGLVGDEPLPLRQAAVAHALEGDVQAVAHLLQVVQAPPNLLLAQALLQLDGVDALLQSLHLVGAHALAQKAFGLQVQRPGFVQLQLLRELRRHLAQLLLLAQSLRLSALGSLDTLLHVLHARHRHVLLRGRHLQLLGTQRLVQLQPGVFQHLHALGNVHEAPLLFLLERGNPGQQHLPSVLQSAHLVV
mmetsp:Transcript_11707/g.22234  ORF Transcript_11707/g.22234 Transcript_11707/m.22234 type:complete len:262 (+) Transcript_11707:2154-2939(+)